MNPDVQNYLQFLMSGTLPDFAEYIAVDKNREIWVFDVEPTITDNFTCWDAIDAQHVQMLGELPIHIPLRGDDWKGCCMSVKDIPTTSMTITSFVAEAHANAVKKGFWDDNRELGTTLMLIVSELGEALEADRVHYYSSSLPRQVSDCSSEKEFITHFEQYTKDTFQDEIADTFIRLADLCGQSGIDIEAYIKAKMSYNALRPYKHNKEY